MGGVKNKSIKRIAHYMLDIYPELFTKDFEANKQILKEKAPVKLSKKERNKIAGYIVRLLKLKEKAETEKAEEPSEAQ